MDTTLRDPLVGQVLDGRYLIESRIAVGGMATVYRAVDTRLDRLLAVKVMHPALAVDRAFVDRFIREAKSAARLDHPNVVGVYDQGNDGTRAYLAMEYVAGCTLRDVLRARGALQPRAALDIAEPVLAALGAAHRAGLVHRDMKPENVLIGDDGRVKVADFGLVRSVGTDTSTDGRGSVLGTASYLAPEQIREGVADRRGDVYACGVLLYEMLTGARPHTGDTPAEVLYRHLHTDVPAPSEAVPGLPAVLDALVTAATAREPRDRPADAVDLLARLRTARATLTGAELDALPPAARTALAAADAEGTAVLPRTTVPAGPADGTFALNRTARLQLPPDLIRPDDGPAGGAAHGRPASRRGVVALLAALVVLLGGGALVWYVGVGQFTTVPAVLSESRARAEARLRAAGLGVSLTQAFSETVGKGEVISTSPGPGGRIRGNGTVTVVVSRGPRRVSAPRVAGLTLAAARRRIDAAGLTPGTVGRAFDDTVPAGRVVSTDPPAGSPMAAGHVVALTVSRGPAVALPDVVGDRLSDAEQALQSAGLKVEVSGTPVFSDDVPKDSVATESPGAGRQVGRGETVTLTVSKGQQLFKVPDVTGLSTDDASKALKAAGFQVDVIDLFFTGTVFDQSPEGGGTAPKNATITLWAR